jgi:hypothetical protein
MRFGKTTALVFGTAVLTISGMGSASAAEFGTGP